MAFSTYDPHARYRNKAKNRVLKFFGILSFAGIFALAGFLAGKNYGVQQDAYLQERLQTMQAEYTEMEEILTQVRAEAQTANMRYAQLREEINEKLPDGPVQKLAALIREQLSSGINPERLAFVIKSARPPQDCTDAETKRFVIDTPAYQGPESVITIADGQIRIFGEGASARNDNGEPEAWFDPAKPVEIAFQAGSQTQEKKKDTLPIQHSLILGPREYRFTVEEGSRSFAKVTFDSCAYP